MTFTPIKSSSAANCYLLEPGLMLEAGLTGREMLRAGIRLSGLDACLVTHYHGDHSKGVKDILKTAVPCYMSRETAEALDVAGHHRVKYLEPGKQAKVGKWSVMPFATIHDTPGSLGYLLAHGAEKVLFATDTAWIAPRFRGLTVIAIEANYCPDILRRNVENGSVSTAQKNRLLFSHFSIDNVIEFLKANDLSRVREIHLMHLSSGNSNADDFKARVEQATGKPVLVAEE